MVMGVKDICGYNSFNIFTFIKYLLAVLKLLTKFVFRTWHKQINTRKLTHQFTNKDSAKKWILIASKLNAIPGGQKDWKQWRKTWQDIKSRIKSKQASIKRYERGTGGGPPLKETITSVEEKVLSVINPTSIVGDGTINESNIEFVYEDDDDMEYLPIESSVSENMSNKQEPEVFEEAITPKQNKRSVASNRLLTSATVTTHLANLSKERLEFEKLKFEYEKAYREQKLTIMEIQAKAIQALAMLDKNK
ncbi:hypothetical protein RN001_005942 [Aquatica leii]|uniref:Regulatory protein zeste n=1 Tax=Aquatica leii TaxID=1421715 RepID=A0AAN7PDD9_9COLE|nr:hypothetical protein RN001_005942 [Aquatica leii]